MTVAVAASAGIQIVGLSKRYGTGTTAVDALKDVNLRVAPGEVVGLIGPSGSGKTTLLKCLGAITTPTHGRMTLGGSGLDQGPDGVAPRPHRLRLPGSVPDPVP